MERLLNIANHNAVRTNVLAEYGDTNIGYVAHVFSLWQTASLVSWNSKHSLNSICSLCQYTIPDNLENSCSHDTIDATNMENDKGNKCYSEEKGNNINNKRYKGKYSFGNDFIKRSAKCDELVTLLSITLLYTLHVFRFAHGASLHKTHEANQIIELLNVQISKLRATNKYTTFINELTGITTVSGTKFATDANSPFYGYSGQKNNIISQELSNQDTFMQQSEVLPLIAPFPVVNETKQLEMQKELPESELFPEYSSSETSLYVSSTYLSSSQSQEEQQQEEEWEEEQQELEEIEYYQEKEELEDDLRNEIVLYVLSYCNHVVGFVELFQELFATNSGVDRAHGKEELWWWEQEKKVQLHKWHAQNFHCNALSPERERWCYSIEKVVTILLEKLSYRDKSCCDAVTTTDDDVTSSCSNDSTESDNSAESDEIISKQLPPELYALVLMYSMLWCRVKCVLSVIKMYNAAEALQFVEYTQLSFAMHQLLRQTHVFQQWQESVKMIDEVASHDECDAFASDASQLLLNEIGLFTRYRDLPQNAESDFSDNTISQEKKQQYQVKQNETGVECEKEQEQRTEHALRQQMPLTGVTCRNVTIEPFYEEHHTNALIKRSDKCELCKNTNNNNNEKNEETKEVMQERIAEREWERSLQHIIQAKANVVFSLVLPTCCPYLWYLQYVFAILHTRYALQFSACLINLPLCQESNDSVLNKTRSAEKNSVYNGVNNHSNNNNTSLIKHDINTNQTADAEYQNSKEEQQISHTKQEELEEQKQQEENEEHEKQHLMLECVTEEKQDNSEENIKAQTSEPFHLVYLECIDEMSKNINDQITNEEKEEKLHNNVSSCNVMGHMERVTYTIDVRTFLENYISAALHTFRYPSTLLVVANHTQWHGKAAWHSNRYTLNMGREQMYLFGAMSKQSVFVENNILDVNNNVSDKCGEYDAISGCEHDGNYRWDSENEFTSEDVTKSTLHTGIAPWVLNVVMPLLRLSNDKDVREKQEQLLIRVIAFNLAGDAFNDAVDNNADNNNRNHVYNSVCSENINDKTNYVKSKCNQKDNGKDEHVISFLHHNSLFYAIKSHAKHAYNKTFNHRCGNNTNRMNIINNGNGEMYFIVHMHVPFHKFNNNENALTELLKRHETQALRVLQCIRTLWDAPWLPSYARGLFTELHHMK